MIGELKTYYGDIHNHCGISYGHGPLDAALANARMQLDFASVTGHALWPDMPREGSHLKRAIEYHETGFKKLALCWDEVARRIDAANDPGHFVTFLTYEMHSCEAGDHTICYRDGRGIIHPSANLAELQATLARLRASGTPCMAIPHHIGYKAGHRGVVWELFKPEFSPVVEIMSMHGCAESDDAPYNYLHSMGPRDHGSLVVAGLRHGHVFGLIGCTDHHSAHPGSHGHGRMAVLAPELTREAVWAAIEQRRTTALTGDRIDLRFQVNDALMGEVVNRPAATRIVRLSVRAGGAIERVELLKNEQVLHRRFPAAADVPRGKFRAKIGLEVGWGSRRYPYDWDVRFGLSEGTLHSVEPRFKGPDILAPDAGDTGPYRFSAWERDEDRSVRFRTQTQGSPSWVTHANHGFSLEIEATANASIFVEVGGKTFKHRLGDLLAGARSGYVNGYGTPGYRLTAAMPASYECDLTVTDNESGDPLAADRDVYRVRVAQKNNQWAWSSPIWIAR